MDTPWTSLFLGLFLSELLCLRSSVALPQTLTSPKGHRQSQSLPPAVTQQQQAPEQVNTVRVLCHPDALEVVIRADLFDVGAPVDSRELRLGVERSEACTATASSQDEYRIFVGIEDCGTKHWISEDSLVYTNLLIYNPIDSPEGIVRMDEAVIPVECHYTRKYSLSSSSLVPTWIPFTSKLATVETLEFKLRLMTDDWMYEKGSNMFYLGDPINIEASVRIGHHMGLRVFLSSCVATLEPDMHSDPKYIFVENGCLVDSELPDSKAHFLPRTQDDKLQLVIEAFKFHNHDAGQLYITCHLNAAPVADAEAPNKACTMMNGRWRSADGNDYLCGYCKSQREAVSKSGPSSFGPRGFGKPVEATWRSGLPKTVWDHKATVGPLTVLQSWKSAPLPAEELPAVLHKIHRPALYGSHWRGGTDKTDMMKGLLPGPSSELDEDEEDENETGEKGFNDALKELLPNFKVKEISMDNSTAAVEMPTNTTVTSDLLETSDPKK
ncbi:zona pellucida sperm-binding protein 3-like [Menidia menidia]